MRNANGPSKYDNKGDATPRARPTRPEDPVSDLDPLSSPNATPRVRPATPADSEPNHAVSCTCDECESVSIFAHKEGSNAT